MRKYHLALELFVVWEVNCNGVFAGVYAREKKKRTVCVYITTLTNMWRMDSEGVHNKYTLDKYTPK